MRKYRNSSYLLLIVMLIFDLAGCAAYSPTAAGRYEQEAIEKLKTTPVSSTNYKDMDYELADFSQKKTFSVDQFVYEIDSQKSYYAAIQLPNKDRVYSLELGSKVGVGSVLRMDTFAFRPVITFLDSEFNRIYVLDEQLLFIEERGMAGNFYKAVLDIIPEYKYMVIHSDEKYYGKYMDSQNMHADTGTNSTVAAPIPNGGFAILETGGRGSIYANTYPYGKIYLKSINE